MDTPPLFDLPHQPLIRAGEPTGRRAARKDPDPSKIRWGKYRPTQRVACDDCLAELVAAGGGPVARAARWRRQQHGQDRLLCGGQGDTSARGRARSAHRRRSPMTAG